jgi:class 3 adenylate cyclase/tetratricopeptide (TPR) repeat protein
MKCSRCQHENESGAKFCEECATPLALACARCGRQLSLAAKFCPECAHPTGLSAPPPPPRFGSPESYTPGHLAERILTSKAALEGERKQVTVLFADLKGSFELLADRDPEEARALLDPVLGRMMEAVHRYEGTVNQVMGDGIMALFGAPLAHEDHAVRACYAALRMQEAVKRYAAEAFRSHGVNVQIRVGLNSGEVVVRAIASDLRMDYTAVGHTTHLSARMEQLASPGCILITPETLRLAEGFVEVKPLGPAAVKGLSKPVEVYELLGAGLARTRFQAATARGLTRFVGRRGEIEQLWRALDNAVKGHGQTVAVIGEPGVGKSRLYYEFSRSHRTHGCLLLESSAVSYGKAIPYLPVTELLKTYFQIETRDDPRKVQEKVTGKLLALDRSLEAALAALLALLDVPVQNAEWQALDPAQRRHRILEAVKRLLLRESEVQPLLLVFEDLHWIDTETQACLDGLVESIPAARILILVNYRPEYQHGWGSKTYCTQLRIDPLPPEGAEGLLEALLGSDTSLLPLKQLLIERTEGNPFFLEESVRTFAETRVLEGTPGAFRLLRPLESIRMPATVQAMLAARIDRLSPGDKQLLEAAAVIGKDVPLALLEGVVERPEAELQQAFAHLQATEFLREGRLFPELEYTFNHALTHEVAYASLLQERRRALHLKVLTTLERRPTDGPTEEIERLARHALGGESWDKAARYLRQTGLRATTRSAYRAAAGWFEEALRVLARLPESPDTLARAIDLRLDLRVALIPLGQYHRVLDLMREAEALATRLGDLPRLGRVLADMCARLRNVVGEHAQAIDAGRRALAIAAQCDDRALEGEAQYRTGQAYFALGDYSRAIDLLSRSAETAESRLPLFAATWSHAWLALTLSNLGNFVDATSHANEAFTIAERADHPFSIAEALTALGAVSVAQGNLDLAIDVLGRGVALMREWQIQPWATLSRLGYAYALSGRLREALGLLEEVVARSAPTMSAMGLGRAIQLAWLAETYLLDHRPGDALGCAQQALSLSQRHHERGHEAWSLRLLGEIGSHADSLDVEATEGHYRRAMDLAIELGMRPLVAHCQFGLGKLYRTTGKPQMTQEHLARATTMYRDMGMTYWLEQAEAETRGVA